MSQTIPFLNVAHLEKSVQYCRWCGLPCCRGVFFLPLFPLTLKVTGICRGSEDISTLLSSEEVAKQKNYFSILVASLGKNAKLQDSSPCSCWVVVLFSRTMFHWIKVLVLLFAVEKSVPSPPVAGLLLEK